MRPCDGLALWLSFVTIFAYDEIECQCSLLLAFTIYTYKTFCGSIFIYLFQLLTIYKVNEKLQVNWYFTLFMMRNRYGFACIFIH